MHPVSFRFSIKSSSKDLADYPISYFYGEDGKSVGEGLKCNLAN